MGLNRILLFYLKISTRVSDSPSAIGPMNALETLPSSLSSEQKTAHNSPPFVPKPTDLQ